ncbi:hypothetical protein ruthe_03242 [Rubellimicrobium thermophilum DSM 16684]|uniref:Uncharacterized protein n=1 Tax=Rubellimicrobium thermophilum DSM 16684 TaxID=1123069 RepID=S9RXM1_9RHOB|nr:hypothetical protein ruthe_03242 [Rubellimicrobium thermophilum DSM 16684]
MAADQPHRPRVLRLRRAALEQALAAAGTAGAARPEDRETDVPASVMPDPGDETGRALGTASTGEPPAGDQTADDATPQGEAAPASGLSPEAEAALQAELAALEAELAMVDPGSSAPEASASEPPEAEAVPASEQRGDDPALLWTDEPDMAEEGGRPRAVENLFAADADTVIEGTVIARDDAGNDGQPGPQDDAQAEAREPTGAAAAASPAGAEAEPPSEAIPLRPVSAHPILGRTPEADEAALSRIISRTDAVLADPEAQRRREAIAQLKAAVAATEAARRLGETDPSGRAENRQDAFRDDLRQVVHPRRPLPAAAARGERPRPAPLKLVASQRVDLTEEAKPAPARQPRPAPVQPVRPRRVMLDRITAEAAAAASSAPSARTAPPARAATAARTTGSFAAFAAEMGATSLTDILEAAAVYTSVVEGAEDFSRPQILDKLHEASPHPVSREDGLRSFGILLRTGRIMRVRGGRFAVAGDSRFHPDRRAG